MYGRVPIFWEWGVGIWGGDKMGGEQQRLEQAGKQGVRDRESESEGVQSR